MNQKQVSSLFALLCFLVMSACNNNDKTTEPCKPMRYSDSFEAAFVKAGACGSLNDVEYVKTYNGEKCTGEDMIVDMKKYSSSKTDKMCGNYPIYSYTKK